MSHVNRVRSWAALVCAAVMVLSSLPAGAVEAQTATVGVAFGLQLPDEFAGAAKVTVKGLPAGLKYNVATKMIAGVPTKKGLFNVALSAAGVPPQTFTVTVAALPVWAQGTFNGEVDVLLTDDSVEPIGTASMVVTPQGKVTGKLAFEGKTYAFSAPSYAYGDGEVFGVEATVKVGTDVMDFSVTVMWLEMPDSVGAAVQTLSDVYGTLNGGEYEVYLYRSVWKEAGAAALAPFIGYYTASLPGNEMYGSGYLTFTVDKSGNVKIAGKLADGTKVSQGGVLFVNGDGDVGLQLYIAPAVYQGGMLCGWVWFDRDGGPIRNSGVQPYEWGLPILWRSFNPQATETYGDGFWRELEINGGFYSKLIDLRSYYADGLRVGGVDGLPEIYTSVKVTGFDFESELENPPKMIWYEEGYVGASTYLPNGVLLSLTSLGTGFAAPKSPAPKKVIDPDTREFLGYNYEELENPSGLTFTLNRATGVFTGGFNLFYDYVSARDETVDPARETWTHTVKKMAYEGVLTPVREEGLGMGEGNGFFLWKETGYYDTGKVDRYGEPVYKSYPFGWSYNFQLSAE